jgi:hypothetical protein
MKRLLWAMVLVGVASVSSSVAAEPLDRRSNSTDLPARFTTDGGSYLMEGLRWAAGFWADAVGLPGNRPDNKSDAPPPGITNGSCVDPDGGRCGH